MYVAKIHFVCLILTRVFQQSLLLDRSNQTGSVPMAAYTNERLNRVTNMLTKVRNADDTNPEFPQDFFCSCVEYGLRPRRSRTTRSKPVPCPDNDKTGDYFPYDDLPPRKRKMQAYSAKWGSDRPLKRMKAPSSGDLIAAQRHLIHQALNDSKR